MREVVTSQEKYQKAICYQVEDSGKKNEVHFRGKMKPIDLGMCMQIYPDKNMCSWAYVLPVYFLNDQIIIFM